jgi:hypothetical protein
MPVQYFETESPLLENGAMPNISQLRPSMRVSSAARLITRPRNTPISKKTRGLEFFEQKTPHDMEGVFTKAAAACLKIFPVRPHFGWHFLLKVPRAFKIKICRVLEAFSPVGTFKPHSRGFPGQPPFEPRSPSLIPMPSKKTADRFHLIRYYVTPNDLPLAELLSARRSPKRRLRASDQCGAEGSSQQRHELSSSF